MSSAPHMLLENQICLSLYSATNALIRAYRPFLAPLGLTYPQYLVMLALWDKENIAVNDICRATRLDTGTVTPILKRLEAKGLVYRKRSTEDERRRVISLSDKGESLRSPASKVPGQMACLNAVSIEEAKQIKSLAEKMYQNIKP